MDPKRLREETRREHEATEALLPLGHSGLTCEEYAAGLQALQPIVASWESWAEETAPPVLRELVRARRRSPLLAADLQWLGVPLAAGDPPVDWMEVVVPGSRRREGREGADPGSFQAGFVGALYVMEGSTLGGRLLARHVVAELGESYRPATRYFAGHGERTGAMWREVVGQIEALPEEQSEVAIAAARRAFDAFGRGLVRNGSRA